ncbi:MAG: zinc-dependent metalloprotease, partial [Acidimicrobiales bacterium]
ATDGGAEPNADPLQRIKLEELARVVELHVEDATGLPIAGGYSYVPVSRGIWANRALEGWRPLLEQMVRTIEATPAPRLDIGPGDDDAPDGLQALLGQFASTMGPIMLGMQFGSAAGHLARQALGQYALIVPWPSSKELLIVPQNVSAFATDWSLEKDATLLWVCAHELTVQLVLDRPHITERLNELLSASVVESMAAHEGIAERLGGMDDSPESLQHLMSDPEALLADLLTPGSRATSDRLSASVAALSGYIDHATTQIAQSITGTAGPLSEAWYRYRVADSRGRQAAAALFGFDVSRTQVDRGAAFVRGVVERAGDEGLARLVSDPRALPTPAEVDAPGLWLERIDLPADPDDGQEGEETT